MRTWSHDVPTEPGWFWWCFWDPADKAWYVDALEIQQTQDGKLLVWGAYTGTLSLFLIRQRTAIQWMPFEHSPPPPPDR